MVELKCCKIFIFVCGTRQLLIILWLHLAQLAHILNKNTLRVIFLTYNIVFVLFFIPLFWWYLFWGIGN